MVFSSEDPSGGYGSATALRTFLRAAAEHTDWKVVVVVVAGDDDGEPDIAGVRILRMPGGRRRGTQLIAFTIRATLVALGPACTSADTVVSWQPLPAAVPGWVTARRAGAAHVVRTCGPELAPQWSRFPVLTVLARPLTRRLLASAEAVVVKSALEHRLLPPQVRSDRVYTIPNAVEQQPLTTARHRSPEVRVLAVAQLEAHKGVDRLIRAFALSKAGQRAGACLTIVGGGSQRAELEKVTLSIGARVTFTGRIGSACMPAIYAAHDVLVVASEMEGSSNACLEAMAAGLPVVGPASALEGLVHDGVDGVLAEGSTVGALTAAIDRFLSSPSTWKSMRSAARHAAARHAPEELIRAYARMLAGLP